METPENTDLQLAFDFVSYTNRHIFLTGKAGTGKTTFLHNLKRTSLKRMIVVAPTGVAAINAGGVTIHSFFQLPFHPFIPSLYLPADHPHDPAGQKEPEGYKMSREKVNIIRSLDLLIIDEISMVRADTLDAIDSALRRYKTHHLPFGGVQLLMIGDLQQLAPVVKEDEKELIMKYYETPFFFGSRALRATDYITIELKHIYRQNDQVFIDLLNKIRDNHVDQAVLQELNKRFIPDFEANEDEGYITLTTHNNQARILNDSKLEKLPGKLHSFKARVRDEFPEFSYPTDFELALKKGAQVMFVKNDISGNKLFFNGKIGKLESFEDDVIVVRCPGDEYPIRVEMAEWQNMKYTLDDETKEIQETIIGTFTQYPLKLAWAITIHKSQGLTFERAVIDANAAFAHGQVYVALSRCRNLNGLVLSTRISPRSIIEDPLISGFILEKDKNRPDRKQLLDSISAYRKTLLTELFDFTSITRSLSYCLKIVGEHHEIILGNQKEMLEDALTAVKRDLIEVSDKFRPQLNALLQGEYDGDLSILLQDRVKKAGEFFSGKLETAMKEIMNDFSVETDNRTVRKSVSEALERIRKESRIKSACLDSVRSGFDISKYLNAKARSAVEVPAVRTRSAKPVEDRSGKIQYPALLRQLKEWRNIKAKDLDLPHYMILPQKTMISLANFVPQSLPALNNIKGMGKKKSERFGEELLDIIVPYCKKENIEPIEIPAEGKKSQKIKTETKKISFNLFKEGKSISEIASMRQFAVSTIESHLSYYVGTGEIPINELVSKETTDLIMSYFEGSDDLRIGPAKAALGERVTWSDLRFVAGHLKFLRQEK